MPAGERDREETRLPPAHLGQRNVGAAGVAPGPAPLRLAVASENQFPPLLAAGAQSAPIGEPEKKKNQISNAANATITPSTRIRSPLDNSGRSPSY